MPSKKGFGTIYRVSHEPFKKQLLDRILTIKILFCTTNLIRLHFIKKNESVQYKAAVAIAGAIQGTLQEKLLDELC